MTAHDVDAAGSRLGQLRSQTIEDGVLAAVAFGLALAAAWYRQSMAVPLVLGATTMLFLACRAFVRRFLLLDELAVDRDAYRIPAVRAFGVHAATIEHRRELARIVRAAVAGSTGEIGSGLAAAGPDLEQLADALESESFHWEPEVVVRLDHWLSDVEGSFRDTTVPGVQLRSFVRSVLAGLDQ